MLPDAERPEPEEHDAGHDVGERALQRETDGETGGAERRQNRGSLDPKLAKRGDRDEDQDRIADDRADRGNVSGVDPPRPRQETGRQPSRPFGGKIADGKDRRRADDVRDKVDSPGPKHGGKGAELLWRGGKFRHDREA